MDLYYDVEHDVLEMGREEMLSTFHGAMSDLLAEALNPPPPLPPLPAGLELNTHPQPAESQGGGPDACVSEQQSPLTDVTALCSGLVELEDMQQSQAASQGQCNNATVMLSEGQSLRYVGMLNGEMLWQVVEEHFYLPVSAALTVNTSHSKKRKRENQQDDGRPYVKKPPNAFMLFMNEQRSKVTAEIDHGGKGTAAVNTVLGQRWKSLTREQQAKYFDQAEEEKRLHAQRHPQWSNSHNYGKKRKRQRGTAPPTAEVVCVAACASIPEEVPQQAKKLCVPPVQTALVEPSSSSQLPLTVSWLDSPEAASTSQASPDAPAQTATDQFTLSEEDEGQYESMAEALDALLQSPGGESLVEPSSSSQLSLTDSDDDDDDEPVCPAWLSLMDPPKVASTSQASPDAPTQAETESTLSEEDEGQYESMAEHLEALLQSPESQLPPHTDLCTLDLHQFYF